MTRATRRRSSTSARRARGVKTLTGVPGVVDPTAGGRARRTPPDYSPQKRTKPARGGRPDSEANVDYWSASTEALIGRHDAARGRWLAAADLARAGWAFVETVERLTRSWPRTLAAFVGRHADSAIVGWADEPRPPGTPERPGPLLRPLFAALPPAIVRRAAARQLATLLAPPRRLPVPPAPTTSARAREQYRRAAAAYKRHDAERRRSPHVERTAAGERVDDALVRFRSTWWSVWPARAMHLAGDAAAARRLADELRASTLHELARAFGITDTPPRERPTRAASRRRK